MYWKAETSSCWQKIRIVKTTIFPVVIYRCESWTVKKAERWRIDAFELWGWGRLFRVPWTAGRSSQSILKEINLKYSLEELMLKLQYLSHLMRGANSLEKTLMLGKIEGKRRRRQQRMRWLDSYHWLNGHEFEQTSGGSGGQRSLACCSPQGHKESGTT